MPFERVDRARDVHRTTIVQFCLLKSRQLLRKTSNPLREEIENRQSAIFTIYDNRE